MRTRISKIRNHSIHRNTNNRKTEHHSIPHKGCSRGPKLGTYSDWGLSGVWLLINIYHIINYLKKLDAYTLRFYERNQDSVFNTEHPSAYACQECFGPHDIKDCTKVKKAVQAWDSNMLSNQSNKGRNNTKGGRGKGNNRKTGQGYQGYQDRNLCQDLCFLHWDIKIEKSKILHCKKASSNTDWAFCTTRQSQLASVRKTFSQPI